MPRALISHQLSTSSSLTSQASKNVVLLVRILPLSSLGITPFQAELFCGWWIRQSSFRSMKVLGKTISFLSKQVVHKLLTIKSLPLSFTVFSSIFSWIASPISLSLYICGQCDNTQQWRGHLHSFLGWPRGKLPGTRPPVVILVWVLNSTKAALIATVS